MRPSAIVDFLRLRRADLHQRQRQAAQLSEFAPFFAAMERLDMVWMSIRRAAPTIPIISPRRNRCTKSGGRSAGRMRPRPLWRGLSSEDARPPSHPNLKLIVHHLGGIVPMLEGRIGPGWDQIGVRTSDEDYQAAQAQPGKAAARLFQAEFLS
ncbi:MAG: hypothetical protein R3D52_10180 [Xanthobacteraceae bacterium]